MTQAGRCKLAGSFLFARTMDGVKTRAMGMAWLLANGLVGIDAAKRLLRHKSIDVVAGDTNRAPRSVTALDVKPHAWRQECGYLGHRARLWTNSNCFADPRADHCRSAPSQKRAVHPAGHAITIAYLTPVFIFFDDLQRQPLHLVDEARAVVCRGSDPHPGIAGFEGSETGDRQTCFASKPEATALFAVVCEARAAGICAPLSPITMPSIKPKPRRRHADNFICICRRASMLQSRRRANMYR